MAPGRGASAERFAWEEFREREDNDDAPFDMYENAASSTNPGDGEGDRDIEAADEDDRPVGREEVRIGDARASVPSERRGFPLALLPLLPVSMVSREEGREPENIRRRGRRSLEVVEVGEGGREPLKPLPLRGLPSSIMYIDVSRFAALRMERIQTDRMLRRNGYATSAKMRITVA